MSSVNAQHLVHFCWITFVCHFSKFATGVTGTALGGRFFFFNRTSDKIYKEEVQYTNVYILSHNVCSDDDGYTDAHEHRSLKWCQDVGREFTENGKETVAISTLQRGLLSVYHVLGV